MNQGSVTTETETFCNRKTTFCERAICVQAVAETLLVTEGAGLPIAIVRPSIVAAAWKEPLPGHNIQPTLLKKPKII